MNGYDKGYIALYRKLKNWRYYKNDNIKSVFIHCLLSAYWKDEVITEYRGKKIDPPITVPKGSFITSRRKFADDLGKTEGEIRQAWSKLSSDDEQPTVTTNNSTHEIELTTTQLYTIVKVNKFEDFQIFLGEVQPTILNNYNPQYHPQLQPQLNNNILNKDKKIKRYKDKSADARFQNLNSLTLKLLDCGFISDGDIPEMYDQMFYELLKEYDMQHINVVLDYIILKMKDKHIKNKYFYLKKSLNKNLEKMLEVMNEHDDELSHEPDNDYEEPNADEIERLIAELKEG